jgi:hypothetical protein
VEDRGEKGQGIKGTGEEEEIEDEIAEEENNETEKETEKRRSNSESESGGCKHRRCRGSRGKRN